METVFDWEAASCEQSRMAAFPAGEYDFPQFAVAAAGNDAGEFDSADLG